ncbi:MAG: carboxypeptidase regulatory-like domain-containing protein [Deltaproteobacteria bacterium]|nr:carboxypeptidase regulatory-like domain-containing protein [Deltaproteobacteria bacterium]
MKRLIFIISLCFSVQGEAAVIEGKVTHGSRDLLPPVQVELIKLANGMEVVATTSAAQKGDFSFKEVEGGAVPFLVRVNYQGVSYQEMIQLEGEKGTVDLRIYDVTAKWPDITLPMLNILVRPAGDLLQVEKTYYLQNQSLQTYLDPNGTFQFYVSGKRKSNPQVAASRGKMPIPLTPSPTSKEGIYAVSYPIRPGVTEITVTYDLDYSAQEFFWKELTLYDIDRVNLAVVPPDLGFSSDLFEKVEGGGDGHAGFTLYTVASVAKDHWLAATFKGMGSQPANAGRNLQPVPPQIFHYKWLLLGLMGLFLLAIGYFGWRQKTLEKTLSKLGKST